MATCNCNNKKALHITGSIARTLLALTFLFSGFVKAVDPLGTVYKIQDYLHEGFGGVFQWAIPAAGVAAVCLIALEWLLGIAMLLNVRTQWTSWITLLFYCIMTPLTLYIAIANPVSDCGCFGDALVITNWQTFWKNIILLLLSICLVICRKAIPELFSWWMEIIIALAALGSVAGIMGYSYTHLPQIDFRPYKVGNHIPTLMEIPDDAEVDQYEITLIYAKDGKEQTFTLENYPKGDPEWTFVDQKSVLIKKGYVPPIHDFEIETLEGDYVTQDILESEEPIALVVMYDLSKTDTTQLEKLMHMIHEYPRVYFLTASGEEEIFAFAEELGWDEETTYSTFCFTDPITLKTIVRANPGVIVVQNGTIIDKYNLKNR
ncbi:MAG: DoxX family protein [Paludibacteraceae bacterium]|nr:DoxX family protein [Paludibacteraceae bacterium]MDD6747470.1 DoxX family protein [Paludibacteraceae bacterium]